MLIWYGAIMTLESARLGSITIKNLVFPEWWLLAPLPVCFLLRGDRIRISLQRLLGRRARARTKRHRSGETMGWVEASLLLFGGLVVVMGLGLPVAFSFLRSTSSARGCSSAASRACRSLRATPCSR